MSSESPPASQQKNDWLRRLPAGFYRGQSSVHWQMTLQRRAQGWLTPVFHQKFRELLLHTLARFDLVCPIYCLMPDHMHLLWMGTAESTEQKKAVSFFRAQVNVLLEISRKGTRFQKQAYDHVLRQHENGPDAVRQVAWYIQENPVRAGLVKDASAWSYLGCLLPGYPVMHPLDEGYWDRFWDIRKALLEKSRRVTSRNP